MNPTPSHPTGDPGPPPAAYPRLHLVTRRRPDDAEVPPAPFRLPLPVPGEVADLTPAADAAGPRLRRGADPRREPAGLRVEVVQPDQRTPGPPRLLVVRNPASPHHHTIRGLIEDPPLAVLQERDEFLVDDGTGGAPWSFFLAVWRQPVAPAAPADQGRLCTVCRQPLGAGLVYHCACGALVHHPASSAPAQVEGGPTLDCSRLATLCPRCQRPIQPEAEGYSWLPEGFETGGDSGWKEDPE